MTVLIIAGGRDMEPTKELINALIIDFELCPSVIVSGACKIDDADPKKETRKAQGVDGAGEEWAKWKGVKIDRHYAQWTKLNAIAGPIRNEGMSEVGDELLVIWDGKSKGSGGMKKLMLAQGKPVYEIIVNVYNIGE